MRKRSILTEIRAGVKARMEEIRAENPQQKFLAFDVHLTTVRYRSDGNFDSEYLCRARMFELRADIFNNLQADEISVEVIPEVKDRMDAEYERLEGAEKSFEIRLERGVQG
jgi:hypothetical protein